MSMLEIYSVKIGRYKKLLYTIYRLPFRAIPKVMVENLAMVTMHAENVFSFKGRLSKYYLLCVILENKQLYYRKDFEFEVEQYAESSHGNTTGNNNLPQTIRAINLSSIKPMQGGMPCSYK